MNVQESTWNKRKALICTLGSSELTIDISCGPRILSYCHIDYDNLLYEDTTNFKMGNWYIYGGHRFTVAPETDESYFPDNEPCEVEMINSSLLIAAPTRSSGIQLSLKISETDNGEGFDIAHILTNKGEKEWLGALWAITCVPRSAQVKASCSTSTINFWPGTDPSNWQQVDQQMTIKPGEFRGKAGWHQTPVSFNALQPQGFLSIQNSEISSPKECVDKGSNVEVFICPDFIELETLSKQLVVPVGQSAQHLQQWKMSPPLPN